MTEFTRKRLTDAYNESRRICEEAGVPIGCVKKVKENPRLTSTFGKCRRVSEYTYEIEIMSKLVDESTPYEVLMNTMLHELIHTCRGGHGHGEVFKRYAAKLNRLGWDIQTYVTEAEYKAVYKEPKHRTYKYMVTCQKCGEKWNYERRGTVVRCLQRDPHSCRCHCGSQDFKLDVLL